MGHNIEYYDYPEKVDKRGVESDLNNYVSRKTWQEGGGGLVSPIQWLNHVCDNRSTAGDYIRRVDSGDYDQLAVLYKEPKKKTDYTKKYLTLQDRLKKEREKLQEYIKNHSVRNFKAEYIGCQHCGSKLKRTLLKSDYCVLCREDLRSKTTLDTIMRYENNIKKLNKELMIEDQKYTDKNHTLRWLVKIEYHT